MAVGKTNIYTGGGNLPLTVQAADVRLGKTFTRDCKTVESGTLNLSNLKAENIKNGVNIAGVIGNLIEKRSYEFTGGLTRHPNDTSTLEIRSCPFTPSTIILLFSEYSSSEKDYRYLLFVLSSKHPLSSFNVRNWGMRFEPKGRTGYVSDTYTDFKIHSNGFSVKFNDDFQRDTLYGICFE